MSTTRSLTTLFLLIALSLILPQCSDKNSDDYYREGLSYVESQDFESAERAFQNSIAKNPRNPNGHYGLGGIHNYRKQYDLAEKDFLNALRIDPTFVDAHYSLGYAYEQMGQTKKAEQQFATYRRLKKKMDQYMKEEAETR